MSTGDEGARIVELRWIYHMRNTTYNAKMFTSNNAKDEICKITI